MSIASILWDRDILIAAAALLFSLLLLRIYLRAVRRSMMRSANNNRVPTAASVGRPPVKPEPPAATLEIGEPEAPRRSAVRAVWSGVTQTALVQLAAGLVYALAVTLTWGWQVQQMAPDRQMTWQWVAMFTAFFAWPVVIVISLIATVTWRAVAAVVFAYVALLLYGMVMMTRGTPVTPAMFALNWWHINGPASVMALVFLARPIRAMGPIVSALTVAGALGVFGIAFALNESLLRQVAVLAGSLGLGGEAGAYVVAVVLFGVPGLAAAFVVYIALRAVGRLYTARWVSDQSIQIDAVWLVFAVLQAPPQVPYMPLLSFPLYVLVSRLGQLLVPHHATDEVSAPRLLLLRVFSLGARSSRLFDGFARLWRYDGSVRMIAGPDLANATVEPHEFLDFMAGRLQRRFIASASMLEQRLAESSPRRDPDGRFRASGFFCHDDTWRMALTRLARDSDLVLMDLRGFAPVNQGCVYEIHQLLDAVRLDKCLLVVDATTDEQFLAEVLQQGWARIPTTSPNRNDASPWVRVYHLDQTGGRQIDRLVATLAAMHKAVVRGSGSA